MIWKLSLTGIKNRMKDYVVLFSGLIVASMIFYMFLTIAINPAFLAKNLPVNHLNYVNYIFTFGIVLLMIITFFYLLYANTFLLSMRKHDYGMYMMLGAKSMRISLLIFCETLLTGLIAVIVGIILGLGLTALVSRLLVSKLGLAINHFQVILPRAILGTILFFIVIFFFGALFNARKLTKTQVISLLHEDQTPVKLKRHPLLLLVEGIAGIGLLACGYYVMTLNPNNIFKIIPTALITIVVGSYFVFSAVFTSIINLLLKNKKISYRGIRMFTLGQLKFRLHSYTRILTMISLLFALALGAITVGLNFNSLKETVAQGYYYDASICSDSKPVKKELAKLTLKSQQTYHYKEDRQKAYFQSAELTNKPLKNKELVDSSTSIGMIKMRVVTVSKASLAPTLSNFFPNTGKEVQLVTKEKYRQLKQKPKAITLIRTKDFVHDYPRILKIERMEVKENAAAANVTNTSKANAYQMVVGYVSGFEFMGFFLGLAFLTMLASTLMFKVLSGAYNDRLRYQMLAKMGVRIKLLRRSIMMEIGALFALPGILGIIDVLFGLKLFRTLLKNPYSGLILPFTIFIILYLFYYLLTVKLYEKIVLKFK